MARQSIVRRVRSHPWTFSVVGMLVILLVAGTIWWKTAGPDEGHNRSPTFEERAEGITGVQSTTSDDESHTVKLERNIRGPGLAHIFNRIDEFPSELLRQRNTIVYDIGGFRLHVYNQSLGSVFTDNDRAASVVLAAAKRAHVTSLKTDREGSVTIKSESGNTLPAADAILHTIATGAHEHKVRPDARLTFIGARSTHRHGQQKIQTRLEHPKTTWKKAHRLRKALRNFDGSLVRGRLDSNGTDTTVRVPKRSTIQPARKAIRSALPNNSPRVTVVTGDLKLSGDGPVKPALRMVRRLEKAGATVTEIPTHKDQTTKPPGTLKAKTDNIQQMKRVLSLLAATKNFPLDMTAQLEVSASDKKTEMYLKGKVQTLTDHSALLTRLHKLGYRVTFGDAPGGTYWKKADKELAVSPRDSGNRDTDLDTPRDRKRLIKALRSNGWHGHMLVHVKDLDDSVKNDPLGLRFSSTARGKAHRVLYPGQWKREPPRTQNSNSRQTSSCMIGTQALSDPLRTRISRAAAFVVLRRDIPASRPAGERRQTIMSWLASLHGRQCRVVVDDQR